MCARACVCLREGVHAHVRLLLQVKCLPFPEVSCLSARVPGVKGQGGGKREATKGCFSIKDISSYLSETNPCVTEYGIKG